MPEYHSNEWPLRICKVKEAWELALPSHGLGKSKGDGIIIAHPDTGFTNHPELLRGNRYLNNLKYGRNFFGKFSEYIPSAEDTMSGSSPSHGTTTASLMMSGEGYPGDNIPNTEFPEYNAPINDFVTGIAPKVKVIPIRVTNFVFLGTLHNSEHGGIVDTYASLARGIYYAVSREAENVGVISISMGGLNCPEVLTQALIKARQMGVIICAAAGQAARNFGLKEPIFPGNSSHTICVAGCYENLDQPSEGFYGRNVDITTPGWGVIVARTVGRPPTIVTTHPVRDFIVDKNSNGTSYSTALTAGACALWQAYHNRSLLIKKYGRPFLFDAFRCCLIFSGYIPDGWDTENRGIGILDVEALLKYPLPEVEIVEETAIYSGWYSEHWGDPATWGRE